MMAGPATERNAAAALFARRGRGCGRGRVCGRAADRRRGGRGRGGRGAGGEPGGVRADAVRDLEALADGDEVTITKDVGADGEVGVVPGDLEVGGVGELEIDPFGESTFALAREAARLTTAGKLVSVAGGGDTVAARNSASCAARSSSFFHSSRGLRACAK